MRAGAQIFEHTRVESIQRDSRQGEIGWKLSTSRGPLSGAVWAHEVFVATGGYTSAATPALQKKIIPIGPFRLTPEVPPAPFAREPSPRHRPIYAPKNYNYHSRLTPDRRHLFARAAPLLPQ